MDTRSGDKLNSSDNIILNESAMNFTTHNEIRKMISPNH